MRTHEIVWATNQRLKKLDSWQVQLFLLALILILAELLLFQGETLGITLPIFLFLLGICSALSGAHERGFGSLETRWKIGLGSMVLALLPLVETINLLTVIVGGVGTLLSVVVMHGSGSDRFTTIFQKAGLLFLTMPDRVFRDVRFMKRMSLVSNGRFERIRKSAGESSTALRNWLWPILLSLGFFALFAIANPLIGGWLAQIEFLRLLSVFDPVRFLFLSMTAIFSWPLIRVRLRKRKAKAGKFTKSAKASDTIASGFSEQQIFRALLLFNVLFAVQTSLDVQYLWGHAELPAGVTYSQYVHRGTNILLITALLAAAFILFITAKGRDAHKSPIILCLILLWIGQNAFLVLSTMKRMELYIDAFSLTYLRVAALIWMTLVLIGFALIVVRLVRNRDNAWLINTNLISVVVVLYLTSLANLPHLIADHNVSRAHKNAEVRLDMFYLYRLGEQAIPSIDRTLAFHNKLNATTTLTPQDQRRINRAKKWRQQLAGRATATQAEWRQWSFRRARLLKYLEATVAR